MVNSDDLTENDWKALRRLMRGDVVGSNSFAGYAAPSAVLRRLERLGLCRDIGLTRGAGRSQNTYRITDEGYDLMDSD